MFHRQFCFIITNIAILLLISKSILPCAKNCGADADLGGAVFDGDGVVVTHSH